MCKFVTNNPDIESELLDEVKLFYPYLDFDFDISHEQEVIDFERYITVKNTIVVSKNAYTYSENIDKILSEKEIKRLIKRYSKQSVFSALKSETGKNPPWGSLTGIRPSKLVYDMLSEGVTLDDCRGELLKRFSVTNEKSNLICDIVGNQVGYIKRDNFAFNLYIHIPFCTSKCNYCSFTTEIVSRCKSLIPEYIQKLKIEIDRSVDWISKNGKLFSVYVGGGTPTAIDAQSLHYLLSGLPVNGVEFTVEAGRPDTITEEKLDAIKSVGATRVCVNPQTFNDETLVKIGRAHTSEEFFEKYALAKKYGFDINIDLIAGLTDETIGMFKYSLDSAFALSPENITVHTLSRKNGSMLKQQGKYYNDDIALMTEYANEKLCSSGYIPYYLYRQKQMLGNFENVGYCKPGKQCVNNITTMEDCMSVVACGAGAISKIVENRENRIERLANLRDVRLYMQQFDKKLEEKENFLKKQFTKLK